MTNLHSSQIRSLAETANNISNPITEVRTSPKEHEWLSDLSPKHIAAISKLLKSKDTKALEQYLISNRLMGRDGLVQGKNLDRSAIEIVKRSFADVHEEVANNNISNPITEVRTSPKEHEWLSDLSPKHIAAISKLLKSKDTKALEQYLISNRLMGRDGLVQGKNLDRSAIEIVKRSFADVHEQEK